MKILISLIISLVMIAGILAPISVVAANHPCPFLPDVPVTATWTTNHWTTSYFWITLTDADSLNGQYEGWCIDIHRPTPVLTLPNHALLVCSYSAEAAGYVDKPENIDLVNWIFNHNPIGTDAGGSLGTYTLFDVQIALWRLLENTTPDYVDGADFASYVSPDRVAALIAMAQANGEGYMSDVGDFTAIFVIPTDPHPETGTAQQISLINVIDPPVVVGGTVIFEDTTSSIILPVVVLTGLLIISGYAIVLTFRRKVLN